MLFAQTLAQRVEPVIVTGRLPLPALDQLRDEIPAAVKVIDAAAIEKNGGPTLADTLNSRLGSVNLNGIQGNPFQPDINVRGFTASPILGTPQGVAVMVDGVRFNQPFGDVVSWDLLPKNAISSMLVLPGSNPLFGLNALGAVIAITTKDGPRNPGRSIQAGYGSNARRSVEIEYGGSIESGLNWYATGTQFRENGWRINSASDVRQAFAKLGFSFGSTDIKASVAFADNTLNGNALQEARLLAAEYKSIFTQTDTTKNRSHLFNLAIARAFSETSLVSGNVYHRRIHTRAVSSDVNQNSLDQSVYQPSAIEGAALAATGFTGVPSSGATASNTPFPKWRGIAQGLLNDEPAKKCNGLINDSATEQSTVGSALQWSWKAPLAGLRHQIVVGGLVESSHLQFAQSSQLGYLNPDRSVTGIASFADGKTGGSSDGEAYDTRVELNGRVRTASLYFSDTVSPSNTLHFTAAARHNRVQVENRDNINPGGGATSLDGDHRFSRVNPSLGVAWNPSASWGVFTSAAESSRAPTTIELGCANPDVPCKLPNALAGDPPLRQVVTRTLEAGVRGDSGNALNWSATAFRSGNRDDLLFVADNQSGFGYFRNFGKTRRQGFELEANATLGRANIGVTYPLLDASFQSPEVVNGSANSTNDSAREGKPGLDGTIRIQHGNRIPLIRRHIAKLFAEYAISAAWRISGNVIANGSSFARGNENNAHQPDGRFYLGSGRSAGFAVLNLAVLYKPFARLTLNARVNNLFDTKYSTGAQLGANPFTADGAFQARPFGVSAAAGYPLQHSTFYAPGAPRAFWVNMKYAF